MGRSKLFVLTCAQCIDDVEELWIGVPHGGARIAVSHKRCNRPQLVSFESQSGTRGMS
jgi:hypothetical protein